MLDQLYAKRAIAPDPRMDGPYDPEQAIFETHLQNEGANRLTAFFTPWHGRGKYTDRLARRLAANGSAVLSFDFHDRILEPNADRVLESFAYIQETATARIEKLVQERGYDEVRLLGLSLGGVALSLVADRLSDFSRATMVAAASNLATSMWASTNTQDIRQDFENQGITIEQLDVMWQNLAPSSHAEALNGKDVQLFIATRDYIIPSAGQKEFLGDLKKAGARTNSYHLPIGHYAMTGAYCYFGR